MKKYDRALIVAEPWIDKILSGEKIIEMRSRATKIRGRIGLIRKGSGLIVGDVWLDECLEVRIDLLPIFKPGHCIDYKKHPELNKYHFAWKLERVNKYDRPIPYKHPQGAVVWVKV